VADSINLMRVGEKVTATDAPLHIYRHIVGGNHRGLLTFPSTWNQCRVSVDHCDVLTVCLSAATFVTDSAL